MTGWMLVGKQVQKDICFLAAAKWGSYGLLCSYVHTHSQADWFASDANANWRRAAVMTQLRQQQEKRGKVLQARERERFDFLWQSGHFLFTCLHWTPAALITKWMILNSYKIHDWQCALRETGTLKDKCLDHPEVVFRHLTALSAIDKVLKW